MILTDQSSMLLTNPQYMEMKYNFVRKVEKAKNRQKPLEAVVIVGNTNKLRCITF
jgi:hypothetical protein